MVFWQSTLRRHGGHVQKFVSKSAKTGNTLTTEMAQNTANLNCWQDDDVELRPMGEFLTDPTLVPTSI